MPNALVGKKGVILFIVLATVMVTVVLAGVILNIISSQYKLTHHQVSRIQAYYACLAGINIAKEDLRTQSGAFQPISNCPPGTGCDLTDPDFPPSVIQPVKITFIPPGSSGCLNPPAGTVACINATVSYPSSY
ncbi:MAG TPA: hypothetical protein VMD04_00935 [Candidatus Margulisiibacteriota bacterium]|nr:hypothetical protein [Candidatus Margulisiibacteriota bacterium]